MRFSLIVATLYRVTEVGALLESLANQTFKNFEVIIVDQNEDDRLSDLLIQYAAQLTISRLRSLIKNNSNARNLGISMSIGEIIAFPDDDCLYLPDTLKYVDIAFHKNPALALLAGPAISPSGNLGSGRWHTESGPVTTSTIWTSIIEFNIFIDIRWAARVEYFDESFGIGAPFGSAEGVDLALSILKAGGYIEYDFLLRVVHPDKTLTAVSVTRAFKYGTGLGGALAKHHINHKIVLTFLIRPLGGMILSLFRLNLLATKYYWKTFRGRITGYLIVCTEQIKLRFHSYNRA